MHSIMIAPPDTTFFVIDDVTKWESGHETIFFDFPVEKKQIERLSFLTRYSNVKLLLRFDSGFVCVSHMTRPQATVTDIGAHDLKATIAQFQSGSMILIDIRITQLRHI